MSVTISDQHHRHHGAGRPAPPGINLGIYNIWDGNGFGLPQAICSVKQGNYYFVLLTYMNILDEVYYHNHLWYSVAYSEATFTASGGGQGGV